MKLVQLVASSPEGSGPQEEMYFVDFSGKVVPFWVLSPEFVDGEWIGEEESENSIPALLV